MGDGVGEHLGQVQKDAAAFVQDLDARFDLEVLAHADVERMQCRFAFPEEVGDVEHVRGWEW